MKRIAYTFTALALVAACSETTINNTTIVAEDGGVESGADATSTAEAGTDGSALDAAKEAEAGPVCAGDPAYGVPSENCWPAGACATASCSSGTRYFCSTAVAGVFGNYPKGHSCVRSPEGSADERTASCCPTACVRTGVGTLLDCGSGAGYACPPGVAPPDAACVDKGGTADPIQQNGFRAEGRTYCCPK